MRRPGPAAVARLAWLALASMPVPLAAQVTQQPPAPPPPEAAKPPEEKPIDTIGVPQAEPPPVQPPPPETAPLAPAAQAAEPARLTKDEVPDPGYLPGYRRVPSLGLSPYTPQVGAFPGGLTPGFAAPMPANEWTFQFTGFMNVTAQYGDQPAAEPGARPERPRVSRPASTRSTSTSRSSAPARCPGTGSQMNFRYGNRDVTANLTLSTWNPSQPTTLLPARQPELHQQRLPHLQRGADREAAPAGERRLLLYQLRQPRTVHGRHLPDAIRGRRCAASASRCSPTIR